MKKIICISGCRYAIKGQPHLPQIVMYKGKSYDVADPEDATSKGISLDIANRAVSAEKCEWEGEPKTKVESNVQEEEGGNGNDEPNNEPFDLDSATLEEVKDFVRADPELDEVVDFHANEETIRSIVKAYLEL